jgi:putative tricarboxylic transport membrane protein
MAATRARAAGELVFALLMLLFSAFMLWSSIGISGFKSYTSAGSFPMAASATMLICALIVVAQTVRAPRAPAAPGESPWAQFSRQIVPRVVLLTTLAIVVYMLTLERLGFIVGSYLFLLVSMRILGSRRWGLNLLASAVVLGAIYLVFQTVFAVVLPEGTLWQGLRA